MQGIAALLASVGLTATFAQQAPNPTALAECRVPLAAALASARRMEMSNSFDVSDDYKTDRTINFKSSGLKVLGLPATLLSLRNHVEDGLDQISFETLFRTDYPSVRSALLTTFGKTKCDDEGRIETYCSLTLPDDSSDGARTVRLAVEPTRNAREAKLFCRYSKDV